MAVVLVLPVTWQYWFPYDRALVADGQLWRLISSNFIHLSWGHFLLNGLGLMVIAWLFAEDRRTIQWAADLMICSVATAAGLFLLNPEILWCVGLSGALHGLFVIGALDWVKAGIAQGKWLLLGLGVKLIWEQAVGEMPFSGNIIGGSVVTDAHVWGAMGGLIAVSVDWLWRRRRARL